MAFNDIKARILQVVRFLSPDATFIGSDHEIRYDAGVGVSDDFTLVPKWYVDQGSIGMVYFTDNDNPGINVDLETGIITFPDLENDFPTIFGNGIIRLHADAFVSGEWSTGSFDPYDVVKDVDGNITDCKFNVGNENITTIQGRIY